METILIENTPIEVLGATFAPLDPLDQDEYGTRRWRGTIAGVCITLTSLGSAWDAMTYETDRWATVFAHGRGETPEAAVRDIARGLAAAAAQIERVSLTLGEVMR